MSDPSPQESLREKEIFLAALEIENEGDRAVFLAKECGDDSGLRKGVEGLLRGLRQDELLDSKQYHSLEEERVSLNSELIEEQFFISELGNSTTTIGDYELLEEIGRGAMGVVFRSRQISLNREVAVKVVLSAALASEAERTRFQVEAKAAAQLNHPNIVPVYEIGRYERHDFYSMSYVRGGTLGEKIQNEPLTPGSAARLIRKVALAVQEAHQRGIIHRDLKPDNILLSENGEPQVADFGLACWLDRENDLTLSGQIMGTPQYMAPELIQGRAESVSTSVDIYALGAILYEALAGRPVFHADSVLTILKQVQERVPQPLCQLNAKVDRDLETVVLKCLEKKSDGHYRSARALAEDLDAWLEKRPIKARPSRGWERLVKWTQRKPLHAAFAAVGLLFVLTLGIGGPFSAFRQTKLREDAEIAKEKAELASQRAQRQARANRRLAYTANMRFVALAGQIQGSGLAENTLISTWLPSEGEEDYRGWEWYYDYGRIHQDSPSFRHGSRINWLEFSPYGEWLLFAGDQGSAFRHTLSGTMIRGFRDGVEHLQASWSPDGRWVATLSKEHGVKILDHRDGTLVHQLKASNPILSFTWHPQGEKMAVLESEGSLHLWQLDFVHSNSELEITEKVPSGLEKISWSPDGNSLAAVGSHQDVFVWRMKDFPSKPAQYQGHGKGAGNLAWQSDSSWLATGGREGKLRIWGVPERQRIAFASDLVPAPVSSLAWNPDGQVLVYACENEKDVFEVNLITGSTEKVAESQETATALAWSAEAHTIAIGDSEGKVQLQRAGLPLSKETLVRHNGPLESLIWHGGGGKMSCLSFKGEVIKVDLVSGHVSPPKEMFHLRKDSPFAWSRNSGAFAWGEKGKGGDVIRLQSKKGKGGPKQFLLPFKGLGSLTWFNQEDLLACSKEGELAFLSIRKQDRPWHFEVPSEARYSQYRKLSVSPKGKYALATGRERRITLWSISEGSILLDERTPGSNGYESDHAWNSNEDYFATGNGEGKVSVWSVEQASPVLRMDAHQGPVTSLAWHPKEERLASAGQDGMIRLWDTKTGEMVLMLSGHTGEIREIKWGPDGRRLVSVSKDGTLRIWNATAGMLLRME